MQCLGFPSRSRSRELYLQEQSLKVAALNGQRLGKDRREHGALLRRQLGQDVDYVPLILWLDLFSTSVSVRPTVGLYLQGWHVECFRGGARGIGYFSST